MAESHIGPTEADSGTGLSPALPQTLSHSPGVVAHLHFVPVELLINLNVSVWLMASDFPFRFPSADANPKVKQSVDDGGPKVDGPWWQDGTWTCDEWIG